MNREIHPGALCLWTLRVAFTSLAAMSKAKSAAPAEMSFEDALKRLEAIVDTMEGGELPLEALLAKFEEGAKLAAICQAKLAEAETKIRQIEKDSAGGITLKPVAELESD